MSYYHEIEKFQSGSTEQYVDDNYYAQYLIEFSDGESYLCKFFSAWDSDNCGDLDIEMEDPLYDEFHQLSFDIIEIIKDGPRRYNTHLVIDYRDWPEKITDTTNKTIVYPPKNMPEKYLKPTKQHE